MITRSGAKVKHVRKCSAVAVSGRARVVSSTVILAHTPASDANPAKRIAAEKEEQGSGRRFRRKAEAESSGLCDDAGAEQCVIVSITQPFGGFPRGARE